MAASIASLASTAGLPRALVDLRHQATHNELPSLAVLRSGAGMALHWLEESYWKQQSHCIVIGQSKINETLRAYIQLHIEAAQLAHTNQMHIHNGDDEDDSDKEEVDQDANDNKTPLGGGKPSSSGYNAAEAKKQRKALLTELKSKVPQASMHLLLPVLFDAYTTVDNINNNNSIGIALTVVLDHLSTHWPSLCPVLFKTATSQLCQMSSSTTTLISSNDDRSNNESDVSIEASIKWIQRFILEIPKEKEKEPKGWRPNQEQLLHVAHSMMKTLLIINCSASSYRNPSSSLLLKDSLMRCMADVVMCLEKNHPGNQRLLIQWNQLCIENKGVNEDSDLIVGDAVVEQLKQNLEKVLKGKAAAAGGGKSSSSVVDGGERRRWRRVDHQQQKECAIGMVPSIFDDNGEVPLLDCEVGDVKVRVRRRMEGGTGGVVMKREEGHIQEEEASGGIADDHGGEYNADGGGEERAQKYRRLTVDAL